jgi:hypothetical protein
MIQGLRASLADLREKEKLCHEAVLAIEAVLVSEGAIYPDRGMAEPRVERPGAALDAALAECQRTAARRAKETAAQKPVKAAKAARQADAPALRTCPHCDALYTPKRKDQTNCLAPACRKLAQAKAKAEWEAMRAKAPAAANKATAAAPAPVSRVDRIKAAAARVDGLPQSVLDAAAEAAASEAL